MTIGARLRSGAVLALVYVGAAELADALHLVHEHASIIWPPTGIALAAVLLYGPKVWPGIAVGAFVTVIVHMDSWPAAVWITTADVVEVLLAALLLKRLFSFHTCLDRVADVLALMVVVLCVALLSATISVTGLVVTGIVPVTAFSLVLSTWWWGHLSGGLVVAPLILTWGTRTKRAGLEPNVRTIEVVLLACAVVLIDVSLFSDVVPAWFPGARALYYLLPLLLWAGLRFGPRGAATASFAVSMMAIASSALGGGPFSQLSELQSFVSISSVTTLVLSAMALERLRAVQRKSAMQLAALDAIVSIDTSGRLVEVNPAAERLLGYRAADVIGRPADQLMIPPRSRAAFRAALHAYLARPALMIVGQRYRTTALRADGTELPVEIAVANASIDGELTITGFIRDRTAEIALERALRGANEELEAKVQERTAELMRINGVLERSEELLRQAESLAQLGSFELDLETGELEWSDELFRIYGRDRRSYTPTLTSFFDAVDPSDRQHVREAIEHAIRDVTPFGFEERIVRPDGSVRTLHSRGRVFKDAGESAARLYGCCQDVTEQRIAENQLKLSLHEKEVLLREIHHRVKNNLQVISSLLNLQVSAEISEQARRGLVESQSRIQSMALVHQQLYQSRDLARIDFSEYLQNLATRLLKAYNVGPERIELAVSGPPVELDIDRAIPCGLIVNELLANAIDHAFPDGRHGHIWVTLERHADAELELDVRDDGVGIPAELDLDSTPTFGLQIARTLTKQLEGTIELVRDQGTLMRLVFPDASRVATHD